jgi:hypothetical protein
MLFQQLVQNGESKIPLVASLDVVIIGVVGVLQ